MKCLWNDGCLWKGVPCSSQLFAGWQTGMPGSQSVQVGLWKHPGVCGDLRISSLHTEEKCPAILEGAVGTDQSCAWQANRGLCFQRQITLSWGNSFMQLFESNRKPAVFNFAIKMGTWLFLQMLNASVETGNITLKKNRFSTRFKLFHYFYLLVIICAYIVLPLLYMYNYTGVCTSMYTHTHSYLFFLVGRAAVFTALH